MWVFYEKDAMTDGSFRKKQYLCKQNNKYGFRKRYLPQVGTSVG